MALTDDLLAADRQLYPTGRAFWMPQGGDMEKLHIALNESQDQFYNDMLTLFSGLLPDNEQFTEDDASNWERIYGLSGNANLTLAQRMDALFQCISTTGNPAKQHYQYIEAELQKAGFDVYIYENIFSDGMGGYTTKTPYEVSGDPSILSAVQYGDGQYGDNQYGQIYINKLANSINEKDDYSFNLDDDLSATFFVGGPTLGTYADVSLSRHDEFRQLLLTLKPASTVGFLFINYV
jgi:hypothetical protein